MGEGSDFEHVMAVGSIGSLPEPYGAVALAMGRSLMRGAAPPVGWLPASGDDEVLRGVYTRACESLSEGQRALINRGEIEPQPGDAYWAKVEPVWKAISIYDGGDTFLAQFKRTDARVGGLFAAHWCQSEVRNGGFRLFFENPTGVLAPEAVEGFTAIGMPGCAALVAEAMRFFGAPYPRERTDRQNALRAAAGMPRAYGDLFTGLDHRFFELINEEADGFPVAADRYSTTITALSARD